MKTLTLPESEIITLASAAKKYGTVKLAKAIGIGKSQLYRIWRGHNRVTSATADKINAWLNADAPKPEEPEEPPKKRPSKSRNLAISQLRNLAIDWDDPDFLQLAARKLATAIMQGRLKKITILLGGHCKCGD